MRSRLSVLALPALLALALLASGCGGGGESSTTTAKKQPEAREKLSKAQFISQGDAICAEVNTAIGSVGQSAAASSSQTTQVANLYTGLVQSLRRLGQPGEMSGYSELMGAAEELAMIEGEVKAAADKENAALLEEASQKASPAVEEFQRQAALYGFEECSEGPHAPVAAAEAGGEAEAPVEEGSGGVEAAPEEAAPEEEFVPEEAAPEEVAPETGGAGGAPEEAAPERTPETGGESGGIGPE